MMTPAEGSKVVTLRDVSDDDLPVFFEHQRDPDANRIADFPARDRDAFMAHWETRVLGDETVIAKTVLCDAQVVGNVVSFVHAGKTEVGYWIGREHWGKGIASKALAEFLRQVKTRPLYAGVAEHNAGSIRVLEKCGFSVVREDGGASDVAGHGGELLYVLRGR